MLLTTGHGTAIVLDGLEADYPPEKAISVSASLGFESAASMGAEPTFGHFGYFFEEASTAPDSKASTAQLDALGAAMVADPVDSIENSGIAPVFTYFGQFIDHDITANTDRKAGISVITDDIIKPVARADVKNSIKNLRQGALNLDNLYGSSGHQSPFVQKLANAMRYPHDRAKMFAGVTTPNANGTVPKPSDPADKARDLLRLKRIIGDEPWQFTEAEIKQLPQHLRGLFLTKDGEILEQRAIIGDMRNDENLIIAQLQLAFIRLHNRIVDHAPEDAPKDRDALFAWARTQLSHHYQWLVVNAYLPAICDAETVADVLENGPKIYDDFYAKMRTTYGNTPSTHLPLPLEFSVACFRFGHTMVRDSYDYNRFFGRPDSSGILPRASFGLLFAFTGGGSKAAIEKGKSPLLNPTLPSQWPIEWDRFVFPPSAEMPDRAARKIDTNLALPLKDLTNEGGPDGGILRHLAMRNLRRGHKLNIPTAQACITEMARQNGVNIPALTADQLLSGPTSAAVADGGFDTHTPLWFYVLKEAEVLGKNGKLGPLGSRIIAETLIGLIQHDQSSYWHLGTGNGSWQPKDGVMPDGVEITDMAKMMEAARLL